MQERTEGSTAVETGYGYYRCITVIHYFISYQKTVVLRVVILSTKDELMKEYKVVVVAVTAYSG